MFDDLQHASYNGDGGQCEQAIPHDVERSVSEMDWLYSMSCQYKYYEYYFCVWYSSTAMYYVAIEHPFFRERMALVYYARGTIHLAHIIRDHQAKTCIV